MSNDEINSKIVEIMGCCSCINYTEYSFDDGDGNCLSCGKKLLYHFATDYSTVREMEDWIPEDKRDEYIERLSELSERTYGSSPAKWMWSIRRATALECCKAFISVFDKEK